MRPTTLRGILTIYVLACLAALIIVQAANYSFAHRVLVQEVDKRLAAEAAEIIRADDTPDIQAMADRIRDELADHDSADLFLSLTDRRGRLIAGNLHFTLMPPLGYSDFGEEAGLPNVRHGRALTRALPDGGKLIVVSDNDVVDGFNALLYWLQLLGLGASVLIIVGGALGIAFAIRQRMRAMQRTVDAVIAGDLHSRIPVDSTQSEFNRQAVAFNTMLDRIDALMLSVKHAAKDVTHELKSPLARLRSKLAALARHAEGDRLESEIVEALEQSDQVLELFSSLMRLWEIEGGNRRDRFAAIDLAALVSDVVEGMTVIAEDHGHPLALSRADTATIDGDANLLRQMVVNLIENAMRHTPIATPIDVRIEALQSSILIIVTDQGPGIPAEKHGEVIRRFGRLAANSHASGQGLGLTLVDAIARLHGGSLRLDDAKPGLRVIIDLPRRP